MPVTESVKKALRQSEKRRRQNNAFKTRLKEIIKAFLSKPDESKLKAVYSVLDKADKKHIYHKNKVNRLKSRLSKKTAKHVVKKTTKKPVKKKSGKKISKTK